MIGRGFEKVGLFHLKKGKPTKEYNFRILARSRLKKQKIIKLGNFPPWHFEMLPSEEVKIYKWKKLVL